MSRRKSRPLQFEKQLQFFILFVLATIPLLFGAAHPFVQGIYAALLLVFCGGFLLLNLPLLENRLGFRWILPFLLIFFYVVFMSLPLPLSLVAILSPHRAAAITQVNRLAGTDLRWVSLSFSQLVSCKEGIYYLSIFSYFLCLKVLLQQRDRIFFDRLLRVMIVVGIIEALYGLLQVVSPSLGVLWLKNAYKSACGTIIYKNQYAAFLNFCWPVALAVGLGFYRKRSSGIAKKVKKHKHRKHRHLREKLTINVDQAPLYWLATALIMLAVLFSLSRAGTLSMLLIWFIILGMLPFSRKRKILLFISILLLVLGFGSILGFDAIVKKFALLDATGRGRIRLWEASLSIIKDYPWTGSGLESYRFLSPVYLEYFPGTVLYDRAHNEYIELIIELGIPMALFLFLWLMYLMSWAIRHLWKVRQAPFAKIRTSSLVGITSLASIAGFMLHGAVDFAWRLPANLFYCATLAAFVAYALWNLEPGHRSYGEK